MADYDPNDARCRWKYHEDTNTWEMPELQAEFLEWMVSFPRTGSQAQWARDHNLDERTVRRWKKDLKFQKEWQARAQEMNLSVERIQDVLNNLHSIATSTTGPAAVNAATRYLEYVGKFVPTKKVVVEAEELESLSNEDLARLAGEL